MPPRTSFNPWMRTIMNELCEAYNVGSEGMSAAGLRAVSAVSPKMLRHGQRLGEEDIMIYLNRRKNHVKSRYKDGTNAQLRSRVSQVDYEQVIDCESIEYIQHKRNQQSRGLVMNRDTSRFFFCPVDENYYEFPPRITREIHEEIMGLLQSLDPEEEYPNFLPDVPLNAEVRLAVCQFAYSLGRLDVRNPYPNFKQLKKGLEFTKQWNLDRRLFWDAVLDFRLKSTKPLSSNNDRLMRYKRYVSLIFYGSKLGRLHLTLLGMGDQDGPDPNISGCEHEVSNYGDVGAVGFDVYDFNYIREVEGIQVGT